MRKLIRKALVLANKFNSFLLLKNILKTSNTKRVLISYITKPFECKTSNYSHTNLNEVQVIVNSFNELDYIVDIVDYNLKLKLDFNKYDLIFGFGETFEESFYTSNFHGKRIYYATGAHVNFQNHAEVKRVIECNKRKSCNLFPKRIVPWNWSISTAMSDALIVIGNSWTASTYIQYCNIPVYSINATGLFNSFPLFPERNINKARRSFLWFGSLGLIHKGLDICLDYFSIHAEFDLHICGPKEDDFFNVYKKELSVSNIFYHGFVNPTSENYKSIVSKCLFSIMPSCSEGQSTALLTTMGTGLIPIASKETGIDVSRYGFLLDSISIKGINTIISTLETLSDDTLLGISEATYNEIQKLHTLDNFKKSFIEVLSKII